MCFTLFGLTFSIVRATTVAMDATWYAGAERFDADHFFEEARAKGNLIRQMH
jgi:hypothetical protein